MVDLGAWAAEKYVVSDPIFDEEDLAEDGRRALQQKNRITDEHIN